MSRRKRSEPDAEHVRADSAPTQIRVAGTGPRGSGELNQESPTWIFIDDWAKHRLVKARERNDISQSEVDTALLRGEIATLKELIGLPDQSAKRAHLEQAQGSGEEGRWVSFIDY